MNCLVIPDPGPDKDPVPDPSQNQTFLPSLIFLKLILSFNISTGYKSTVLFSPILLVIKHLLIGK